MVTCDLRIQSSSPDRRKKTLKIKNYLKNGKENDGIGWSGSNIAKEFVEHLGNVIHIRLRQSVEKVIRILNTKVNALIANFWFAPIDVTYRLFIAHCMPLYEAQLWDYDPLQCCERFFYSMAQGSSQVVVYFSKNSLQFSTFDTGL